VLVRCRSAGTLALAPGVDALVQHGGPESVDSVMVDGRWLMRGQGVDLRRLAVVGRAAGVGASSPVVPCPHEGPLTESTAGAQPRPKERVLMPQTGH
jgi:hypothetical protein